MRLTAPLPIFTLLRTLVTQAIFLTEIPEERCISKTASSTSPVIRLYRSKTSLQTGLPSPLEPPSALSCPQGEEVALVVADALSPSGGDELTVAGFQMLGHLLLEDFFEDGLHALTDAGLHFAFDVLLESLV